MRKLTLPEGPLTFRDYFNLNADTEDVLACFEYSYRIESCELPRKELEDGHVEEVRRHLLEVFTHAVLTNEAGRREFLIAPVLMEATRQAHAKITVELSLEVDEKLKGTLDYFIQAPHNILVIEAKNGELKKGFTQLAVELVALDRWLEDSPESRFYGAVSMGDVWKFGFLDRAEKRVTEDLNTYSSPKELEAITEILVAVLTELP